MAKFVEYLDPSTWKLYKVDVDNDAAGEDWLLVPEGADFYSKDKMFGVGCIYFYKDKSPDSSYGAVFIDNKWQRCQFNKNNQAILWQRHTQPEELPFIDDEPKVDNVNHPSHYTQGDIECIDAIKASMSHEAYCGYLKGNVQKYMWRYEHKGGVESLKKAQWYLDKLIGERTQ